MGQTIKIGDETKAELDKCKIIKREPYDSVIQRLLKVNENVQRELKNAT